MYFSPTDSGGPERLSWGRVVQKLLSHAEETETARKRDSGKFRVFNISLLWRWSSLHSVKCPRRTLHWKSALWMEIETVFQGVYRLFQWTTTRLKKLCVQRRCPLCLMSWRRAVLSSWAPPDCWFLLRYWRGSVWSCCSWRPLNPADSEGLWSTCVWTTARVIRVWHRSLWTPTLFQLFISRFYCGWMLEDCGQSSQVGSVTQWNWAQTLEWWKGSCTARRECMWKNYNLKIVLLLQTTLSYRQYLNSLGFFFPYLKINTNIDMGLTVHLSW